MYTTIFQKEFMIVLVNILTVVFLRNRVLKILSVREISKTLFNLFQRSISLAIQTNNSRILSQEQILNSLKAREECGSTSLDLTFQKIISLNPPTSGLVMGVDSETKAEDESRNGLSSWYDRLRCDPASLSSSVRSSFSGASSSRTVSECDHGIPVEILADILVDEDEEVEEETVVGEDASRLLENWINNIKDITQDPFQDQHGQDPSAVNPRTAVRIDPYHGFSWRNKDAYNITWNGSEDTSKMFQGRGVVAFEDGGEIGGIWKDGVRYGKCSTVCPGMGITQLIGNYKNNKLCGVGKVFLENGDIIEAEFRYILSFSKRLST